MSLQREYLTRGAGKGDQRRPTNNQAYREGYDNINWKKKAPRKKAPKETSCGTRPSPA